MLPGGPVYYVGGDSSEKEAMLRTFGQDSWDFVESDVSCPNVTLVGRRSLSLPHREPAPHTARGASTRTSAHPSPARAGGLLRAPRV
ncbi:unnamed protein product [Lampetra fluviatilis]